MVCEGVRNPEWYRKDQTDEIGIIVARLFHRVRDCLILLHIVPMLRAKKSLALFRRVWERRIICKKCGTWYQG